MAPSNTQSVPLQLEAVRKKLVFAYGQETCLLDLIKPRGDVLDASTRNMRVPQIIRPGGVGSQANMDFGDLGRGSGSTSEVATLTTVSFAWALEISKLAEYATDDKQKAVQSITAIEAAQAVEMFKDYLDGVYNTNGTGQKDTILAINGTTLTVNNADMFMPGEILNVYATGLGSSPRGTMTVTSSDPSANEIVVNATPGGTIVGDALVINISGAAANPTSIEGLLYHHVDSTSGSWNNLSRSTYPSELKTPHVAAANASLTPGMRRLLENKMRRVLKSRYSNEPMTAYMGFDQQAAWEQNAIQVQSNIFQQIKGDESPDMLKKQPPMSFGGIPIKVSTHATKGRVDVILTAHWVKGVTKEFGPFEEGGQTVFPVYGASGGLESGYIQYWDTMFNITIDQPRYGGFIDGLAVISGY